MLSSVMSAEEFLKAERNKDLLRLVTAGSVDDGKSTLIGRLLYDSQSVYEDQLVAMKKASERHFGNSMELALLTDGLRAEREQGITIDVAYRYFSTARRKFILADTPGHEQYTRNMATGASTADLAILLVDARRGVQPQSRRHAYILGMLGIRDLVVVINKMDLVDFDQSIYEQLTSEFSAIVEPLGFAKVQYVPISAAKGDNVVTRSDKTPWYDGPSVLEYLESVEVKRAEDEAAFRFPVQRVLRPTQEFRGYSGQISAGAVRVGDPVIALPGFRRSTVQSIVTWDGELQEAFAPQSVSITLADEIDISRGDTICAEQDLPSVATRMQANLIWFSDQPSETGRPYLIKHTSHLTTGTLKPVERLDIQTLQWRTADGFELNDVGVVELETARPLFFDPYRQSRNAGSFIVIDPAGNNTVGAGMILHAMEEGDSVAGLTATAQVWNLNGRQHRAELLEATLRGRGLAVVSLLSWEEKAAHLLLAAGFQVVVLHAPGDIGRQLSGASDEEAVQGVLQELQGLG